MGSLLYSMGSVLYSTALVLLGLTLVVWLVTKKTEKENYRLTSVKLDTLLLDKQGDGWQLECESIRI